MDILTWLFYFSGSLVFVFGLVTLAYFPLSLFFEWRRKSPQLVYKPLVSVIVPAYNEAKVISHCVQSILDCPYPQKEIILVDDGSKDDTLHYMQGYADHPEVSVIAKTNGGKASALNAGLARAKGEILFCVDADGIFAADTIDQMLLAFDHPKVGAVCGNDSPVNLDRLQTKLLSILSHVGTGFVRRALAVMHCLPIVSGNCGAFRREAIEATGGFLHGFIGEDLELTWRMHKAGYRVNFAPRALVYAEVPSSIKGLWKQRVRWARGLLQTTVLHWPMLFNLRYKAFGVFLPINLIRMIVVPAFQLLAIMLLIVLLLLGLSPFSPDVLSGLALFGGLFALFTAIYALVLDKSWASFKYLYTLPLWLPYSLLMNVVMLRAIWLELRQKEATWNKLERTGVISR